MAGTMIACGTPGATQSGRDYSSYQNLADVLRAEGLQVNGQGNSVKIFIRGISTIKGDTQPLFIVDNVPMGTSYAVANNAVNVKNIKSIKILKDKSDLTIYGERGTNGVIIIKTSTDPGS
jgi:TonB-dependent SusC/RagA subfamily outer membrane receptor